LGNENFLQRYKTRQYIEILAEAKGIIKFDSDLYIDLIGGEDDRLWWGQGDCPFVWWCGECEIEWWKSWL